MLRREVGRLALFLLLAFALALTLNVGAQNDKKVTDATNNFTSVPEIILPKKTAVYIIRLSDPPLASYTGGIRDLTATSPQATAVSQLNVHATDSIAYRQYLLGQQDELVAAAAARLDRPLAVRAHYTVAFNGLALVLDQYEAAELEKFSGVTAVYPDDERYLLTDSGPAWIQAPAVWADSGIANSRGEGIIVGVIDTGVNLDHPSFADVGGDGYNHTNPLGSGNYVGWCDPGNDNYDPGYACNDKLIGAWDFADEHGESDGPEDSDGHGSHTASTAAGNVTDISLLTPTGYTFITTVSGVAPHANLIIYDACIVACPNSALLNAVDQAVADGVDVINYSISGGIDPYNDPVEQAFLSANEAGVFVAAAGGNFGPAAGTLHHHGPWVTTIAAITHNRKFRNALVNLQSSTGVLADIEGKSMTAGYGTAPIVYAGDFGDALCAAAFPADTWTQGEIVICDRGDVNRVAKGENVAAGGAGGLILTNTADGQYVNADIHVLPAVHVSYDDGQILKQWLATGSGHQGQIAGTVVSYGSANGDVMAAFSSRGPNTAFDVLKPDVAAPGADILAAVNTTDPMAPPEYGLLSGTSMAAPHVAGAAVLLRAAHPTWSPDEIRSALMMTAVTAGVRQEDERTPATPFDRGAGRIDVERAVQAGLVLHETRASYETADPDTGGDPRTLNLPSMANGACLVDCSWTRVVSSTLGVPVTWTAGVSATNGLSVTVTPASFTVGAFNTQSLNITADVTGFDGSQGWGFAAVNLSSPGQETLHLPLAVKNVYSSDPRRLSKAGPAVAPPGAVVTYQIVLDNLNAITQTFTLTDTLPAGASYVPGSATGGLVYDSDQHRLTWSGEIGPGTSGYEVTEVTAPNYVNLGDVGTPLALCDPPDDCDDRSMLLDLDQDYSASVTFYEETLTALQVSANGLLIGPDGWTGPACTACPQKFPESSEPNQVIAGFWRDIDMSNGNGQGYAAVITGLLENVNDRVFYVNWHDAGQYGAPLATSRHAIAMVLDGQSEPAGRIYFIYDDITNGDVIADQGYAIGLEDKAGEVGLVYSFASCDGASCVYGTPVGELPADGTTLRLDPAIVGGNSARIFTYQVQIDAPVGTLLSNVARVTGSGVDGVLTAVADTYVDHRIHFPLIFR